MQARQDVLSRVLDPLRLSGMFLSLWSASAPWAVAGGDEPCALIHYLVRGGAWIQMPGEAPQRMEAGDQAMFPRGDAHIVGDAVDTPVRPLEEVLPERHAGRFHVVETGGGGAMARMLCAGLHYEVDGVMPLYRLLPPLLLLRRQQVEAEPLLAHMLRGLASEVESSMEGREQILLRGFELVFVLGLRAALNQLDTLDQVALAFRHPGISRALSAIYERFDQDWTLDGLARHAGMSRSSFASAFKQMIGESPGRHLTKRRLAEASRLLAKSGLPQEEIAQKVGYDSVVGMHLAFRKVLGVTPGSLRA